MELNFGPQDVTVKMISILKDMGIDVEKTDDAIQSKAFRLTSVSGVKDIIKKNKYKKIFINKAIGQVQADINTGEVEELIMVKLKGIKK